MQLLQAVNEFVVKFANVNGSGSASANGLFAKAVYRMGIPISPKNIFPSNIQGLPTWYEVRISEKGYLGRSGKVHLGLSVNPESMTDDIREIQPGGYFIYDSTKSLDATLWRNDISIIGIPFSQICLQEYSDARKRQLLKNVVYIGALAAFLDIELTLVKQLVKEQFKSKGKLIAANERALDLGFNYARQHYQCPLGLRLKPSKAVGNRILLEGNNATGLGALYAGATVAAWYPITPSTSVVEAFAKHANKYRIDATTGRNNFAIVQAEDELSAIGMVIGAAWNGARSFTATSGPGISLMSEFLGLAYFAEVPVVLVDVQRAGPSTGMPTRTQQSDILACAYASHGDTKHILLFPKCPTECFELTSAAFDLAERLQTPVIILSDLDLGMNEWLTEPLQWDDNKAYDRGKVLDQAALDAGEKFYRYQDVDNDGICYRTYPGAHPEKGAFFTRGSSRTEQAIYTEKGEEYVRNVDRLSRKFNTAKGYVPQPECKLQDPPAAWALVYFGTSTAPSLEALDMLESEGVYLDTMRIKAFPFSQSVDDFIDSHEICFIVEQNRDGQLRSLLMVENGIAPSKMKSVLNYDGRPITATYIANSIRRFQSTAQQAN